MGGTSEEVGIDVPSEKQPPQSDITTTTTSAASTSTTSGSDANKTKLSKKGKPSTHIAMEYL